MKKSILFSLMVIGAVAAMITAATTAVFTDTAPSTVNTFSSGNVDISSTSAVSFTIATGGLAPGDSYYTNITVSNLGTLALRYAATNAASGNAGLAAALDLGISVVSSACSTAGDFSGGTLLTAAGTKLNSATLFGNPATSHQAGDRYLSGTPETVSPAGVIPGAAGTSEILCVKISLPLSFSDDFASSTTIQGKSVGATFTFSSEQVRNNP